MRIIGLMTATLVITFLSLSPANGDDFETREFWRAPGLKGYGLLFRTTHDPSSLTKDLFVVKRMRDARGREKYEILDSVNTAAIASADTNAIIYESIDNEKAYLILLTLSPEITRDTVIEFRHEDENNWIKNLEYLFYCSIRDSVIVYRYMRSLLDLNDETRIIRISPNNNWSEVRTFYEANSFTMCGDFTQILICTGDERSEDDPPYGSIVIYDLVSDSFYVISHTGDSNRLAKRKTRETPIYYIKDEGRNENIYMYSEPDKVECLTDYEYPYYISSFSIKDGELSYGLCNKEKRDRHNADS